MSPAPLTDRIVEAYARSAAGRTHGRAALDALLKHGLPSARDENWKYANLRPLERVSFVPAAPAPLPEASELPEPIPGFARYVFVDGTFAPALSAPLEARHVSVTRLNSEAGTDPAVAPDERFALLNQVFASDGAAVRVAARETTDPTRLEFVFVARADAQAGAAYPRLEVQLEPQAHLQLIERHASIGPQASFVNHAVRVTLAAGAQLQHYRVQELNARSLLIDTLAADVASHARYRLHAVSTGGQSARSSAHIRLGGERAELALAALSLGERTQVQDSFALIEHLKPNARTEQVFRGIAAGRSRVAFNGKIVAAAGAHGTDSRQSLRGLLAGAEAEIDVRPQLEIYTDDVRCAHGATAGKLDDHMLFYLLSRGLEPQVAQRLLKWAFLEDVVAGIDIAQLRRQIETRLAAQVPDAPLTPESP